MKPGTGTVTSDRGLSRKREKASTRAAHAGVSGAPGTRPGTTALAVGWPHARPAATYTCESHFERTAR